MRLIDADALQKEYMTYNDGKRLMLIDVAPTIGAAERSEYEKMKDLAEQYKYERDVLEESQRNKVEVVRCKDCKHWDITSDGFGECNVMEKQFLGDEYCSFGERKEDDG